MSHELHDGTKVTKLQAIIYASLFKARNGQQDILELLDETTEELSDGFHIMEYEDPTVDYTEKRSTQ